MARSVAVILFILCFLSEAYSQSCPPNLDFESGTFNNWECFTGTVDTVGGKNRMLLNPSGPVSYRHEILAAADNPGLDMYGNFPKVCPYGGNFSVKLGNDLTEAQAEAISYTFTVPTDVDTFTFTYFYAVVFEDPAHDLSEQPRFFVTARDVTTGNLINCASYDYVSTAGLPGFQKSAVNPSVLFKNWTPTSLQFAGLQGHDVQLEFRTADCTRGGHFGYAYLDIASACSNILATAPYCIETNSLILDAPFGFQTYTWYNNDFSQIVASGQSITMSPPPVTSGSFWVDVIPYPGFGCRDTLQAIVKPYPVPDTPDAKPGFTFCQFQTATPLTASVSPGHQLLWYTTPTGGVPAFNAPVPPTSTPGSLKYYVSQKALQGCEGFRREIMVNVTPTPTASFNINKLRQCITGNSFDFTSTSTNLMNPSYTWDFGNGQTVTSTNPKAVYSFPSHGYFNVKLKTTNDTTCSAEMVRTVTVVPKPVAAYNFPSPLCEQQTVVALIDRSNVPDNSSVINKWWWSVNGVVTTTQTPPAGIAAAGNYPVKLAVSSSDGCLSDTNSTNLYIHHSPVAAFEVGDLMCNNEPIRFKDKSSWPAGASNETITKWHWTFDNSLTSGVQHPIGYFNAGVHNAQLITESSYGCKSLVAATKTFDIYPKPIVTLAVSDSCVNVPVTFTATDVLSNVVKWNWDFRDAIRMGTSATTRHYSYAGNHSFTLYSLSDKGCKDTLYRPFTIYDNKSWAGKDTSAPYNEPLQLNANGEPGMQYAWTPQIGLDQPNSGTPVATHNKDQLYQLYSISDKGCRQVSNVMVKRYAGPELYVPNAFTPNNDGKNDRLRVMPTGIQAFGFFAVYNRWGQMVYRTTNYTEGWDGTYQGQQLDAGTYVFVVQATDYKGRPLHRKGTVVLLR